MCLLVADSGVRREATGRTHPLAWMRFGDAKRRQKM